MFKLHLLLHRYSVVHVLPLYSTTNSRPACRDRLWDGPYGRGVDGF